jgi:hypothetical protein
MLNAVDLVPLPVPHAADTLALVLSDIMAAFLAATFAASPSFRSAHTMGMFNANVIGSKLTTTGARASRKHDLQRGVPVSTGCTSERVCFCEMVWRGYEQTPMRHEDLVYGTSFACFISPAAETCCSEPALVER